MDDGWGESHQGEKYIRGEKGIKREERFDPIWYCKYIGKILIKN